MKTPKRGVKKKTKVVPKRVAPLISDSSDEEEVNSVSDPKQFLKEVWTSISPPIKQDDVIGKWFAAVYEEKNNDHECRKVHSTFLER